VKLKVVLLAALAALTLTATAFAARAVVIRGTNGNDTLTGTPANDIVFARAGDDQVSTLDGNDHVFGAAGNDSIDLGGGNDRARGGPGNDTILGGNGNDRLRGRHGDDSLDGGAGADIIHGGYGADTLQGGDGNDRLFMLANDNQPDSADCGPGYDKVWVNVAEKQDTYKNCEVVLNVSVTHTQSEEDDH